MGLEVGTKFPLPPNTSAGYREDTGYNKYSHYWADLAAVHHALGTISFLDYACMPLVRQEQYSCNVLRFHLAKDFWAILTLARFPYLPPSPVEEWGATPGVSKLSVVDLSRKKKQWIALDECSRLVVRF